MDYMTYGKCVAKVKFNSDISSELNKFIRTFKTEDESKSFKLNGNYLNLHYTEALDESGNSVDTILLIDQVGEFFVLINDLGVRHYKEFEMLFDQSIKLIKEDSLVKIGAFENFILMEA